MLVLYCLFAQTPRSGDASQAKRGPEEAVESRSGSSTEEENDETQGLINHLNDQVEGLTQKRTDVREEALKSIVAGIKKQNMKDFIVANREHLIRAAKSGASSPKTVSESRLSCELLNLMAITVGDEWHDEFVGFSSFLKGLFGKLTEFEHKKEVATSLGLIVFLWCEDDVETQSVITFFHQQLTDATEIGLGDLTLAQLDYFATLVKLIGLLLTVVDAEFALDVFLSEFSANLEAFLQFPNTELRCSTGETFAYLCSLAQKELEKKGEYSCFYMDQYLTDVHEMIETITSYAHGDQKSLNKKERDRQSLIFGPVLQTFQDGTSPSENLTINNQTFHFSGWEDKKRLNFFREILGTGFQCHFASSPIIADIFDVFVESEFQRLSGAEKKAFLQQSARHAKLRKQSIAKSRSHKSSLCEND